MEPSIVQGLTSEEAESRLKQFGPNELPKPKSASLALVFLRQFKSPFIYVLLAAAGVSFGLGQTVNAWFIFGVLLINASIGTIQEFSAQQAAAALKKMVPSDATVIRDGKTMSIPTRDVVPGDLVQLASGDKIPADIRLHSVQGLYVDESLLTGESKASDKTSHNENSDSSVPKSICFSGTSVVSGRGLGKVEATGVKTEPGKIAEDVVEKQVNPPLILRIDQFTLRIVYSILVLISIIFSVTVIRGDDIGTVFLLGVALAVSAIPEGLPAAITVALAIGMRRMVKQNVIIRTLVAVEGLGSCTYIATDKTGTLTVNEMTVKRILLPYSLFKDAQICGFGMSAISQTHRTYRQNFKELDTYYEYLDADRCPVEKGYLMSAEDQLRRQIIMRLMCDMELDYDSLNEELDIDFRDRFQAELSNMKRLESDGLVELRSDGLSVTVLGRLLVRNIARVFDAYAKSEEKGFSKAV